MDRTKILVFPKNDEYGKRASLEIALAEIKYEMHTGQKSKKMGFRESELFASNVKINVFIF